MQMIIGIIVALGLFIGYPVMTYNGIVSQQVEVQGQAANVDANLTRRADLIPNLVETVKGYSKHEASVIDSVNQARQALLSAGTMAEKSAANEALTGALGRLLAVAEAYPELKSDTVYMGLMDELAGSENRIAIARQSYNRAVTNYNKTIRQFPGSIVAKFGGFEPAEPFKAEEAAKASPKVKF